MKKNLKKIISLVLVLAIIVSMGTLALIDASATKSGAFTPEDWEKKSDGKLYLYADPEVWKNTEQATVYFYTHSPDGSEDALFPWGSKKGKMTDEGGDIWSFDFAAKGITLDDSAQYGVVFSNDWNEQACDLIFDTSCLGDLACIAADKIECAYDSNRVCSSTAWVCADPAVYAPPVCITSIGNVIGKAFWKGDTPESLFRHFLTSEGSEGLANALCFNGKTTKETVFDTGFALGLSKEEIIRIVGECDINLEEDNPRPDPDKLIPEGWEKKDDGKLYFYVNPEIWYNTTQATVYFYTHPLDGPEEAVFPWGSKKGKMTDEGNGVWSFDFAEKSVTLDDDMQYGVIFTDDRGTMTCNLIFDTSLVGDLAYLTGETINIFNEYHYGTSGSSGSSGSSGTYRVCWADADPETYGQPFEINSLGVVLGTSLWKGETAGDTLLRFITGDDSERLIYAVEYTEKTAEQVVYDAGHALKMEDNEIEAVIAKSGVDLDKIGPSRNPDVEYVAGEVEAVLYEPDRITPEYVQSLFDTYPVTKDEVTERLYSFGYSYRKFKLMQDLVDGVQENETLIRGDVNRDGKIDISDATLIQMFAAEVIDKF